MTRRAPQPPHALTYDTLPPDSRLKRELDAAGTLTIISPATSEPGPRARRAAAVATAWSSALAALLVMSTLALVFGSLVSDAARRLPTWLWTFLMACLAAFGGSLFLLIWRTQFVRRLEQLQRAVSQSTALAARPGRLIVESSGPLGDESLTINIASTDVIEFCHELWPGTKLECLEVWKNGECVTRILPGRDEDELKWVARELLRALRA